MLNFKKHYILKIVNILIAGIFIIDTTGYGYTPPNKSSLRVPLMAASEEGKNRLEEDMVLMLDQKNKNRAIETDSYLQEHFLFNDEKELEKIAGSRTKQELAKNIIRDPEHILYRSMRLEIASLKDILSDGLLVMKNGYGKMWFVVSPFVAVKAALYPISTKKNYPRKNFMCVVFQIDRLKVPHLTSTEDIPREAILKIFVFDKISKTFIDQSQLFTSLSKTKLHQDVSETTETNPSPEATTQAVTDNSQPAELSKEIPSNMTVLIGPYLASQNSRPVDIKVIREFIDRHQEFKNAYYDEENPTYPKGCNIFCHMVGKVMEEEGIDVYAVQGPRHMYLLVLGVMEDGSKKEVVIDYTADQIFGKKLSPLIDARDNLKNQFPDIYDEASRVLKISDIKADSSYMIYTFILDIVDKWLTEQRIDPDSINDLEFFNKKRKKELGLPSFNDMKTIYHITDEFTTHKKEIVVNPSETIETSQAKNNTIETAVSDSKSGTKTQGLSADDTPPEVILEDVLPENKDYLDPATGRVIDNDVLSKDVSDLLRFKSISLYSDKGDEFKVNLYTKPSKRHPGNMWYRLVMAVPNNGDRVGYFDFRIDETNKKEYFDVSWQFDEMDVFDPMSITKREAKIWTGSNEYAIEVKIPYRKEYKGIGSMLMTLGLKIAKEKGMEKVEINANPTDDGKRLREQMGFDDKGELNLLTSDIKPARIINRASGEDTTPIIFKTPEGEFEVVELSDDNVEKYRQDIVRVAGEDQEHGLKEYVEESLMDMDKELSYVVIANNKVVGCIITERDKKNDNILYISTFGVDNGYKKHGIGNALFWVLANEARRKGITSIETDVISYNGETLDFLENRGFHKKSKPSIFLQQVALEADPLEVIQKTKEHLGISRTELISGKDRFEKIDIKESEGSKKSPSLIQKIREKAKAIIMNRKQSKSHALPIGPASGKIASLPITQDDIENIKALIREGKEILFREYILNEGVGLGPTVIKEKIPERVLKKLENSANQKHGARKVIVERNADTWEITGLVEQQEMYMIAEKPASSETIETSPAKNNTTEATTVSDIDYTSSLIEAPETSGNVTVQYIRLAESKKRFASIILNNMFSAGLIPKDCRKVSVGLRTTTDVSFIYFVEADRSKFIIKASYKPEYNQYIDNNWKILKILNPDGKITKISQPLLYGEVRFESFGPIHYYVTNYFEGESLAYKVKNEGLLTDEEAVSLGIEVAELLGYIHKHNIIVRDLKPANIMITEGSDISLYDFDVSIDEDYDWDNDPLALKRSVRHAFADDGKVLNIKLDDRQRPDPQTDIFTIGLDLYYAVTGEVNYASDKVKNKELDRIIACAIGPRDERYKNIAELIEDFKKLVPIKNIGPTSAEDDAVKSNINNMKEMSTSL